MRIVYFGSGAFGLPTLEALHAAHDLVLVVSQPDRPAGRKRTLTATPVAAWAREHGLPLVQPERPNADDVVRDLRAQPADALVVIAYGHKLGPELLEDRFAVNLHASLLPRYRGAAPINRAMMDGVTETGVSVIALASRMDAGGVYAMRSLPIDPRETAGELHDRLAMLGPEAVLDVLARHAAGTATALPQRDEDACPAPKLTKAEGTTTFDQPAARVRARVHGLTPWPGCRVQWGDVVLRLHRVEDRDAETSGPPGRVDADGWIACASGGIRPIEVQPAGGRVMTYEDFRRGRPAPPRVMPV